MPAKITAKIPSASRVTQTVVSNVEKELIALAYEMQGRVQRRLNDEYITATGAAGLVGSWQVTTDRADSGKLTAVRMGSTRPYAAYVEFGTKPHMPPIRPIFQWVEKKLDVVAYGVTFKSGKAEYTGKTVRQFSRRKFKGEHRERDRNAAILKVAERIRWAIFKRGTKPRKYMQWVLDSLGLKYRVVETSTGLTYKVDYSDWLKTRVGAIRSRVTMELGGQ